MVMLAAAPAGCRPEARAGVVCERIAFADDSPATGFLDGDHLAAPIRQALRQDARTLAKVNDEVAGRYG
jgi:hypothetical protein